MLKYTQKTVTIQNLVLEEVIGRVNSGSACYYSVNGTFVFSSSFVVRVRFTVLLDY
jgi:hypothetical protein